MPGDTCNHMTCQESDLPRIRKALSDFGLSDVAATFELCPWCQTDVLAVESPRPDDRGQIRAALIVGGFVVPDASGYRNQEALPVERSEVFDPRMLT
jgi:hypothetical protein